MCDETTLMETGSCSRRCMPSLRSKATVATGSLRSWLLHGGSESLTGRGASHNARASIAPAGSGRSDGVTGSWADLRPGRFRRICGQGVNRLFVLRWLAAFCRVPKSLSYSASFSNDCPNNGH